MADAPSDNIFDDDVRYDLAKQLRIAHRNKELAMWYGRERVRRATMFKWWAVLLAMSLIVSGIAAVAFLMELFHHAL